MKETPRRSRSVQITGTLSFAALLGLATSLLVAPTRSQEPTAVRSLTGSQDLNASSPESRPQDQDRARNARIVATYGKLPLSFEANQGQVDRRVAFLSRGHGYTLFLTPGEAVFSLEGSASHGQAAPSFPVPAYLTADQPGPSRGEVANDSLLTMRIVGANPTGKMTGLNVFPGRSNYFIGGDPKKWRAGVANYARVECKDIYPGVDLAYYGNHQQLEYDFVVTPGGDPSRIQLAIAGENAAGNKSETSSQKWISRIDAQGDLVISRDGGEVRFHKPVVYQPAANHSEARIPLPPRYVE